MAPNQPVSRSAPADDIIPNVPALNLTFEFNVFVGAWPHHPRYSSQLLITYHGLDGLRAMRYFRIFADEHGESHFEDIDVDQPDFRNGSWLSDTIPVTGLIFRTSEPGQFIDWHPAPRRQFVITLSGLAEVEASDGEVRRLGPGTVMLAEDTWGRGHITRGLGDQERQSVFIPLPESDADAGEA